MMMNTSPWLMVKFKSCIKTKLPYAIVRLLTVMWAFAPFPLPSPSAISIKPSYRVSFLFPPLAKGD